MESVISPNAIWLLDAVADGITIQDPTGRLLYANPAAARATGFASPEQMLATPPAEIMQRFELFDEEGAKLPLDQLPGRRALAGDLESERLIEFRIVPTGEVRWSIVKAQPVLNPDGSVRLAINIWTDITERIQRQHDLEVASSQLEETTAELEMTVAELEDRTAEAEERAERQKFLAEAGRMLAGSLQVEDTLRMILHLAVPRIADWATINLVDEEGIPQQLEVAHADPAKLKFAQELQTRYPPNRTDDQGVVRVIRTGESELYRSIPTELLERTAKDAEHLALIKQLQLRSAMIVPIKARDQVLGAITLIRAESDTPDYDEEDLEFAESLASRAALAISNARLYLEAQEANRTKSDFLAVMSHELRTPLTAIFGYAELLSTGVVGPVSDAQRSHLDRIHASASHLLLIIEDILGYARTEAGRDQMHATSFKLKDVIFEAVMIVRPNAEKKELTLESTVDEKAVIEADRAKLRQILINLLGNAVKFTESGSVRIRAGTSGEQIKIEVEDTGYGIDAADFERIFEPFRQLEPSMTRTAGGTGLGLAVSKRFAELMGGRIEVESSKGKGALFRVFLPIRPSA